MKKYLLFVLLLGATSGMAFGQFGVADAAKVQVACPDDECHVAPFFMGHGGFVGQIADGFDDVNFVVTCGLVSTSVKAGPADANGIVAELLTMDNGLACAAGGTVEIHGLMDGGWYWITGDRGSAAASLVAKDVLGNDMVMPTDPMAAGISIESMEGGATSIVTDDASGRMGILHHVLPEPMMDPPAPAAVCGPRYWAGGRIYYTLDSGCMMGDGGTMIVMTGPADSLTGARTTVPAGGVVYRPSTNAPVGSETRVSFGLWGNGSGHISTVADNVLKGWNITPVPPHRTSPFVSDFSVTIADSPNADLMDAGISETEFTLDSRTPMEVVPGAADAADPADGVGNDNDAATPEIDNGFGMHGGAIVYCKQATSRNDDGDLLLHFASTAGGTVMLEADPDGAGSLTALAPDASSAEQGTWAQAWNGANTDNTKYISMLVRDLQATPTADDDSDDTRVPEVVCATMAGDPVPVPATSGIVISSSAAHCSRTANHSVKLNIVAPLGTAQARNADIIPEISRGPSRTLAAATTLTVMCPPSSSSANQDQELVPGNPWGSSDR